jgi:hypothetical protein
MGFYVSLREYPIDIYGLVRRRLDIWRGPAHLPPRDRFSWLAAIRLSAGPDGGTIKLVHPTAEAGNCPTY